MNNKKILFRLLILLAIVLTIISYYKVPFIFFQQDEWLMFGRALTSNLWQFTFPKVPIGESVHFIPLGNFIKYLFFSIFHFNFIGYNLSGLLIHFLNGYLIYLLGLKIFKKKMPAVFASFLFLISSAASEIVMWPVASINMLSLTLALLAWILILEDTNKYKIWIGFISVASMLIIEYAVGLLFFIPIAIVILNSKKISNGIRALIPFFAINIIYLLMRAYLTVTTPSGVSGTTHTSLHLSKNIIVLPLKYFGQLTNIDIFSKLLNIISGISVGKEAGIIGALLILICGVFWLRVKNDLSKNFLILPIFIITSALPFLFVESDAGYSLLPGRYLYFGIAGFALLSVLITQYLWESKLLILKVLAVLIVVLLLTTGVYGNFQKENNLYDSSQIRQNILNAITTKDPSLPQKVIFYTESDSSFYGLPETDLILPFQSGFGQTLLVWYQNKEHLPTQFFQNKYLWEITDQDYQEFNGRGFGYFRDFKKLAASLQKNNLSLENVISFSYESKEHAIVDNSDEIRGRLSSFLAEKEKINQSDLTVSASSSLADAGLAVDGQRETKWDSKFPYAYPQYFEIDLLNPRKVAQVGLDIYNDTNQNQVGFSVFLSDDKVHWNRVFYSKRYPPDDQGLINLYFKPTLAQYIKIEQEGYHCCADWVINELNIYETK